MKRNIQKGIAFVLCGMLAFTCAGMQVNAEEDVQTARYEEITDISQLIQLGLEQKAVSPSVYTCDNGTEEETVLCAEQILSKTTYADGTVEETYVKSGISLLDENGELLPLSAIDSAMNRTGSGSYNGVIVNVNVYYTVRSDVSDLSVLFRMDKVVTTIHNENNSSTPPIRGENRYMHMAYDIYNSQSFYLEPSTKIQSSTLVSSHSQFCLSEKDFYSWAAIAYITLSDGHEIAVQVRVGTVYA